MINMIWAMDENHLIGDGDRIPWHIKEDFKHFKDTEYGEWYGYLRRDGMVSTDLKGNIFKGPFHIPRCEIQNILTIKELINSR